MRPCETIVAFKLDVLRAKPGEGERQRYEILKEQPHHLMSEREREPERCSDNHAR